MDVTATEAKNRFGGMLDAAQRAPVVIGKSGRRNGVLLSAAQDDALLALVQSQARAPAKPPRDAAGTAGRLFYDKHKDWVDEQNRPVAQYGIPGEELRAW